MECVELIRYRAPFVEHAVLRLDDVHALARGGFALEPLALEPLGCKSEMRKCADKTH